MLIRIFMHVRRIAADVRRGFNHGRRLAEALYPACPHCAQNLLGVDRATPGEKKAHAVVSELLEAELRDWPTPSMLEILGDADAATIRDELKWLAALAHSAAGDAARSRAHMRQVNIEHYFEDVTASDSDSPAPVVQRCFPEQ